MFKIWLKTDGNARKNWDFTKTNTLLRYSNKTKGKTTVETEFLYFRLNFKVIENSFFLKKMKHFLKLNI